LLEHIGIQCEWKSSGYEVVEYANALPHIDLILMDIRLPYEDGYEALQKIRASKRLKDIPILAVTAYAGDEQMGRAKAAGFNGFLGKPLNPDLFSEQVRQMIAGEPVWVSQ
jgi:two-component system cell cycle response regulator DivK